jgi:hypothetical protein
MINLNEEVVGAIVKLDDVVGISVLELDDEVAGATVECHNSCNAEGCDCSMCQCRLPASLDSGRVTLRIWPSLW